MSAVAMDFKWSTSFEGLPASNAGNGVTRRIPVSIITNSASAQDASPLTTAPSDKPPNRSVRGSIDSFVDGSSSVDGSADGSAAASAAADEVRRRALRNKYRHVRAVHSRSKPSCLSTDATETLSFIGFRNLMAIVLGKTSYAAVVHLEHGADTKPN